MLAICSDLDGTPDRGVYRETMRFLNTTETTAMGSGVGLEVGNSIHFRAIPKQFAYWDTDDAGREMARALIHSGHIDCLHSFGELVFTREEAQLALEELERHGCRLEVWVDHGGAVTNFGQDIMAGCGDEPGHEAYHADLTFSYGVKYFWRGRVTCTIGQDVTGRLGGILTYRHPIASGGTLLKELAKQRLGRWGNKKYAMHGPNETLCPAVLRDGSRGYEFMRCNPHWGGVSSCDQGRYIGNVLTDAMLRRLVSRGGTCILYTHLGKIDDPSVPFNKTAVAAFARLADVQREGQILVTTTRRLLGFRRAMREITFTTSRDDNGLRIDLSTEANGSPVGALARDDLNGLTFYVPSPRVTRVAINGREVASLQCNDRDHTGRPSVSLPWPRLEFPSL